MIYSTLFKTQLLSVWRCSQNFLYSKRSRSSNDYQKNNIRSTVYYLSSLGILTVGLSYAAVPLYKMFCQVSIFLLIYTYQYTYKLSHKNIDSLIQAFSYGGTLSHNIEDSKVETMRPVRNREIKIHFTADTSSSMQWSFKPLQNEIKVILYINYSGYEELACKQIQILNLK